MGEAQNTPFIALGSALRAMRLRAKESIVEVSLAVEVPAERVSGFENGELRPSEDILDLFISHYNLPDQEAEKLWDLAGYDRRTASATDDVMMAKQPVILLPIDSRVVYTDMVQTVVNDYGVVVNFLQANVQNGQPVVVSRVGMSREHAKSLLDVLQKTLQQAEQKTEPKKLQAPDANQNTQTD